MNPSEKYQGFLDTTIALAGLNSELEQKDTIAYVSLKIPSRLDTFYNWTKWSDCLSCGRMMYRFADKDYDQFAESGFYWNYVPDSVYQFTIMHNPIKQVPDSILRRSLMAKDTSAYYYYLPQQLSYVDTFRYYRKEFKEINGRAFIITGFSTTYAYITHSYSLFLAASTTLKSRDLEFVFQCSGKDTASFFRDMYKTLESISIREYQ